jgi:hypothetical protein
MLYNKGKNSIYLVEMALEVHECDTDVLCLPCSFIVRVCLLKKGKKKKNKTKKSKNTHKRNVKKTAIERPKFALQPRTAPLNTLGFSGLQALALFLAQSAIDSVGLPVARLGCLRCLQNVEPDLREREDREVDFVLPADMLEHVCTPECSEQSIFTGCKTRAGYPSGAGHLLVFESPCLLAYEIEEDQQSTSRAFFLCLFDSGAS